MGEILTLPTIGHFKIVIGGSHTTPIGSVFPNRFIDNYMLLFMQKGQIEMRENDNIFTVHQGQNLILYPDRQHGTVCPTKGETTYYWLHFEIKENISNKSKELINIPQLSTPRHPEIVADYFRRFISYQAMGNSKSRRCQLLLMLILAEISYRRKDRASRKINAFANMAMDYILHNIFPMSTSQIAQYIGCNPDYLGRIFKQTYGVTITETIHRQYIIQARQLLHESNIPIYQTAEKCGFDDPAYFCHIFKKHTGMTPTEYRNKYSRLHIRANIIDND